MFTESLFNWNYKQIILPSKKMLASLSLIIARCHS